MMHEDVGEAHTAHPQLTTAASDIPLGAIISSRDQQRLGTVKDVGDRCFLVNAPLAFDYWLSSRCVATVRAGHVMLAGDKWQVSDYFVYVDSPDDDVDA